MTNYFYYDQDNQKQGPVKIKQLQELASRGIITPTTPVEIERGPKGIARQIPGMFGTPKAPKPFDIGFTRFISNTWISFIWIIVIIAHVLASMGAVIFSISIESPGLFFIALFAIPLSLLSSRMALEATVVFFRIESNTRESRILLRAIKEHEMCKN